MTPEPDPIGHRMEKKKKKLREGRKGLEAYISGTRKKKKGAGGKERSATFRSGTEGLQGRKKKKSQKN